MRARAREILAGLNIDIDVTAPLSSYSIAVQQMIAIARALSAQAKILILDEPTSSLAAETRVWQTIQRMWSMAGGPEETINLEARRSSWAPLIRFLRGTPGRARADRVPHRARPRAARWCSDCRPRR